MLSSERPKHLERPRYRERPKHQERLKLPAADRRWVRNALAAALQEAGRRRVGGDSATVERAHARRHHAASNSRIQGLLAIWGLEIGNFGFGVWDLEFGIKGLGVRG